MGALIFGIDKNSTVVTETDPTKVFKDPAKGDYRLLSSVGCSSAGYTALP